MKTTRSSHASPAGEAQGRAGSGWIIKLASCAALVAVLLALAIYPRRSARDAEEEQSVPPAPWTYDALANRHWDPDAAEWKSGPPPRGVTAPAPDRTPAPWQYDPVNDQHWHAGHGHWHKGPAPPESQRTGR